MNKSIQIIYFGLLLAEKILFTESLQAAATCSDRIMNQDETGVDCGGATCPSCDNECVTLGGETCKFPFNYDMWDDVRYAPASIVRWFSRERTFQNCTDFAKLSGKSWCATKVTSNNRYMPGHWGECPHTINCNTLEGDWLPWETWSKWSDCLGPSSCRGSGSRSKTRRRKIFTRQKEIYTKNSDSKTSHNWLNEETEEKKESCVMPDECPGWENRNCNGGVNIFRDNEDYLISLVNTEEECAAMCNSISECNMAKFLVLKIRDINRCILQKNFGGQCDRSGFISRYYRSYIKDKSESHNTPNDTMKWEWNAVQNGGTHDCRLCIPSRPWHVWNSCHKYCTNIPNELKDMKIYLKFKNKSGINIGGRESFKRLIKVYRSTTFGKSLLTSYGIE